MEQINISKSDLKHWTLEKCLEVYENCGKKWMNFKRSYPIAAEVVRQNNWFDYFNKTKYTPLQKKMINNKVNLYEQKLKKCFEEAKHYKRRVDFLKFSPSFYYYARRKQILDEVCSHMSKPKIKPKGFWTYAECNNVAKLCLNRAAFKIKYVSAYCSSRKNKWLDDFFPPKKQKNKI